MVLLLFVKVNVPPLSKVVKPIVSEAEPLVEIEGPVFSDNIKVPPV